MNAPHASFTPPVLFGLIQLGTNIPSATQQVTFSTKVFNRAKQFNGLISVFFKL